MSVGLKCRSKIAMHNLFLADKKHQRLKIERRAIFTLTPLHMESLVSAYTRRLNLNAPQQQNIFKPTTAAAGPHMAPLAAVVSQKNFAYWAKRFP